MSLEKRPQSGKKAIERDISEPGRIILKHLPLIQQHGGVHEDFTPWSEMDYHPLMLPKLAARTSAISGTSNYYFEYRAGLHQYDAQALLHHLKEQSHDVPEPNESQMGSEKTFGSRNMGRLTDRTIQLGENTYHVRIRADRPNAGPHKTDYIGVDLAPEEKALKDPHSWEQRALVRFEAEMRSGQTPRVTVKLNVDGKQVSDEQVADLVHLFFAKRFAERGTPKTGRSKPLPSGQKGLPEETD